MSQIMLDMNEWFMISVTTLKVIFVYTIFQSLTDTWLMTMFGRNQFPPKVFITYHKSNHKTRNRIDGGSLIFKPYCYLLLRERK